MDNGKRTVLHIRITKPNRLHRSTQKQMVLLDRLLNRLCMLGILAPFIQKTATFGFDIWFTHYNVTREMKFWSQTYEYNQKAVE